MQAAESVAEEEQEEDRSVPAMMLPRAVALAKAAAVPLPASPSQGTPGHSSARSSGNARVRIVVEMYITANCVYLNDQNV